MDIKDFEPLFSNWYVDSFIGSGSFGKVYKIRREEYRAVYESALKWISIPQDESELDQLRNDSMDDDSISLYYEELVGKLTNEIQLMSKLRGHSNIVSYEDHVVVPKRNGPGFDIFIRMELLTSLSSYYRNHACTRSDVIQIGIDICNALELCQRYNIIHRDIKPDNIFLSETGNYKLGDFGIARQLEHAATELSKKGTYNYMAPEVYKAQQYDSTVDLYSLGIVMYRLLNGGRLPFLPAAPNPIRPSDNEQSLVRRISGEALPKPNQEEGRLGEIVLKACAYYPKDRYSSPKHMREELQAIQFTKEEAKAVFQEKDNLGYIEPSKKDSKPHRDEAEQERTESVFGTKPNRQPENAAATGDSVKRTDQEESEHTQSVFQQEKETANESAAQIIVEQNPVQKAVETPGEKALIIMLMTFGILIMLISHFVYWFFLETSSLFAYCFGFILLFCVDRSGHILPKKIGLISLIFNIGMLILLICAAIGINNYILFILFNIFSVLVAIAMILDYLYAAALVVQRVRRKSLKNAGSVKDAGQQNQEADKTSSGKKRLVDLLLILSIILIVTPTILYMFGIFTFELNNVFCYLGAICLISVNCIGRIIPMKAIWWILLGPACILMMDIIVSKSDSFNFGFMILAERLTVLISCVYAGLMIRLRYINRISDSAAVEKIDSDDMGVRKGRLANAFIAFGGIMILVPELLFGIVGSQPEICISVCCLGVISFYVADRIKRTLPRIFGQIIFSAAIFVMALAGILYFLSMGMNFNIEWLFWRLIIYSGCIYCGALISNGTQTRYL